MAEALFNVVVQGRLLDGFERDQVLLQIQRQLHLPPAQAQQLLGAKPLRVKQAVSLEKARRYRDRLEALGIATLIQPVANASQSGTRYFSAPIRLRRSAQFDIGLWGAIGKTAALALAHLGAIFCSGLGLLCYLWFFARLPVTPPILFSATLYVVMAASLVLLFALSARPLFFRSRASDIASGDNVERLRHFIEELCAAIAVPSPRDIQLDTGLGLTLTAHAAMKKPGAASYTLTIGLPLLLLFSTRQLAGATAAILGSQARPAALRYLQLAAGISARLQACAADEDPLGKRLYPLLESGARKSVLAPLCVPARLLLKLSSLLYARSIALLRDIDAAAREAMDREADRYFVAVAGTDTFALTLNSWRGLRQAHSRALQHNFDTWENDGLTDDLPALVRHYYRHAGLSEPDDRDHSRLEQCGPGFQPGITTVSEQEPADSLLDNPQTQSRMATALHYQRLGIPDARPRQPTEQMIIAADERAQRSQRAQVYFNGWFHPHRCWKLPDQALIETLPLRDAARQLNVCVNEIRRLTPDRQAKLADYARLLQQIQELQIGQHALAAGVPFQFRLTQYDIAALPAELEQRQQQLRKIMDQLAAQEAIMGGRIALGLRLCGQESDLHQALTALQSLDARLHKLELDAALLEQLTRRPERRYARTVAHLESKVDETLGLLWQRLEKMAHPFAGRHRSLKDAIQTAPGFDQSGTRAATRARALLQALRTINERLAQRAAAYGATAEEAYRIERIKLLTPE